MPIYEIEGKRVQTDTPLSDAEIDEIAASIKKPEQSAASYYWNQLKKGVTNLPSLLASGSATQQGSFAGAFPTQEELEPYTKPSEVQRKLGVKDMKPANTTQRYVGAAVEAASDPASYAYPGSIPAKFAAAGAAGLMSEAGGDAGEFTERKIRDGQSSGAGRIVGSVLGAVASPVPTTGTRLAGIGLGSSAKQIWQKYRDVKVNPEGAADAVAAGSAKRLLEHAATAAGVDKIDDVLTEIKKASQYVTGQDAPLLVAAADNPVLRQEVVRLAKTNPEYRARLQKELDSIAVAIDKKAGSIFGPTSRPLPKDKTPLSVDNAQKRIQAIDGRLEKLSDPLQPSVGRTDTGEAIENLVKAKEKAARSKFQPEYEDLLTQAKNTDVEVTKLGPLGVPETVTVRGVHMPDEASRSLVSFIEANQLRDIFGKGSALDKMVLSALRQGDSFKTLSFGDVDSLKRAINKLQRKVKDPVQERKLMQLEDHLDSLRETHIPEWSARLKDIDKKYYEEVGVPFGAQGIRDIDAAKYASKVAPIVVRDRQSLRQFLSAVGEDGIQVAENALLSKAYDTVKDGMVSAGALSRFIQKNKEVLDEPQMARVKEILTKSLTDDRALRLERARIDQAAKEGQKRIADNFLAQTDNPNYGTLLSGILSDPAQRARTLRNIKDLSPEAAEAVRGSLRAELAQQARSSSQGALAFLQDRANKAGIDAVMGPGYQESLRKIGLLSDSLKKADIDKLAVALEKTQVDVIGKVVPGLDVPYVASTLRDRISSNVQKAVRLLTRINTAQAQNAYDSRMIDLLTDPQGVKKLAAVATEMDFKIKNPYQLNKVMGTLFDSLPANVYIGLQGAEDEGTTD